MHPPIRQIGVVHDCGAQCGVASMSRNWCLDVILCSAVHKLPEAICCAIEDITNLRLRTRGRNVHLVLPLVLPSTHLDDLAPYGLE